MCGGGAVRIWCLVFILMHFYGILLLWMPSLSDSGGNSSHTTLWMSHCCCCVGDNRTHRSVVTKETVLIGRTCICIFIFFFCEFVFSLEQNMSITFESILLLFIEGAQAKTASLSHSPVDGSFNKADTRTLQRSRYIQSIGFEFEIEATQSYNSILFRFFLGRRNNQRDLGIAQWWNMKYAWQNWRRKKSNAYAVCLVEWNYLCVLCSISRWSVAQSPLSLICLCSWYILCRVLYHHIFLITNST